MRGSPRSTGHRPLGIHGLRSDRSGPLGDQSSARRWRPAALVLALVGSLLVAATPSTPAAAVGDPAVVPVEPARVLETRPGQRTADGQLQGVGRLAAGQTIEVPLAGRVDVPADADAALLNVTAVNPAAPGFLTVFPCGSPPPVASSVNYGPGDVVPNAVLAKLGAGGTVCIFTRAASDVIVDVNGYVPAGGSLATVEPARILETRAGQRTVDGEFAGVGRVGAGQTVEVEVTGRAGVPDDAAAVMVNVTAVRPAAAGFLTVHPCGTERPLASNVNYSPGTTVPNAVLAKVGTGGRICIFSRAESDVVVDVNGYVPDGGALIPVEPGRYVDSRPNGETVDGRREITRRMEAGDLETVLIPGRGAVPRWARAALINVTAVNPSAAGFITIHSCDVVTPTASNVNFRPGDVVANAVLASFGSRGMCVFASAPVDVVIDVNAYVPVEGPAGAAPDCTASRASQAECDALVAIYNSMSGPAWSSSSAPWWDFADDPCTWRGVRCDSTGVIGFELQRNGAGPIPPEIGDLTKLTDLQMTQVTEIPPEIGDLTELTDLVLSGTYGRMPSEIGNLTKLTSLTARGGTMKHLPSEIGNLTELTRLGLEGARLVTLPGSIGQLTKLERLDATNTQIASLPVEIGGLSSLQRFRLTFNQLQGDITAPMRALRDGAPGMLELNLTTTETCPIVTDASVESWLDGFTSNWDSGCTRTGGVGIGVG